MNALRQDLFKRRLWLIVVALIAAIVAVPFIIHGPKAGADAALPIPPAAGPAVKVTVAHRDVSLNKHRLTSLPAFSPAERRAETRRDAFAPLASRTRSHKPSGASGAAGSSTSTTGTTGTTASSAPSTTAESSAAVTGTTGAAGSTGAGATSSAPSQTATTTSTVTQTVTTSTPTVPGTGSIPSPLLREPTGKGPWTVYDVDVSLATPTGPGRAISDIARLTPLPSATHPQLMFLGVTDHGHAAVFELNSGLGANGRGRCHPDHAWCTSVVVPVGATEQLTSLGDKGLLEQKLKVTKIAALTVHSRTAAAQAFSRYDHTGLCELDLAQAMQFDSAKGSLERYPRAACAGAKHVVPFPAAPNQS